MAAVIVVQLAALIRSSRTIESLEHKNGSAYHYLLELADFTPLASALAELADAEDFGYEAIALQRDMAFDFCDYLLQLNNLRRLDNEPIVHLGPGHTIDRYTYNPITEKQKENLYEIAELRKRFFYYFRHLNMQGAGPEEKAVAEELSATFGLLSEALDKRLGHSTIPDLEHKKQMFIILLNKVEDLNQILLPYKTSS